MGTMVSIYALINPSNDNVFYIGASLHPQKRYRQHIYESKKCKSKKDVYIQSCNSKIEIIMLEECHPPHAWFYEQFYIDLFSSWGFTLLQAKNQYYSFSHFYKRQCKEMAINDEEELEIYTATLIESFKYGR